MTVSLRVRLLAVTMAIAAAALIGVGVFSSRVTLSGVEKQIAISARPRVSVDTLAARLAEHWKARKSWDGARPLLDQAGSNAAALLLVDRQGRVALGWPPEYASAQVSVSDNGELTIDVESHGAAQSIVVGGAATQVLPDGLGTLYAIPLPEHAEIELRSSVNRSLTIGVLLALAAALAATALLSRYILRPVAELTTAASGIAEGDLARRVPVRSHDEIGSLAASFNRMADRLARTEQLRRNMVNDISHELRTPLTRIRCQAESIEDGLASATPQAMAEMVRDVGMLTRLVDDLRDLALSDAGQLKLELAPLRIEDVIKVVASNEPRIRIQFETPLPVVSADERRIRQILQNLIDNALRCSPAEAPVTVAAKSAGGGVEVRVSDRGPGIAAEHLDLIFERFYRVDDSRTQATGGSGLGLAIVKQLVEVHGGSIHAESWPGEGATFVFTLPSAKTYQQL